MNKPDAEVMGTVNDFKEKGVVGAPRLWAITLTMLLLLLLLLLLLMNIITIMIIIILLIIMIMFQISGPETGKRKRVTLKADGKLTFLVNLGGSWHEKLTLLVPHFSLPILAYPFQGHRSKEASIGDDEGFASEAPDSCSRNPHKIHVRVESRIESA